MYKKINEHHKYNTRSSRFNYVTPALMTGRSWSICPMYFNKICLETVSLSNA